MDFGDKSITSKLVVWPWANYLTSPSPSFHVCTISLIVLYLSYNLLLELDGFLYVKTL